MVDRRQLLAKIKEHDSFGVILDSGLDNEGAGWILFGPPQELRPLVQKLLLTGVDVEAVVDSTHGLATGVQVSTTPP